MSSLTVSLPFLIAASTVRESARARPRGFRSKACRALLIAYPSAFAACQHPHFWNCAAGDLTARRVYRGGEFFEELVGKLLSRAVDQALTKLRELSADLGLNRVGERGAAILGFKLNHRPAGGEACHTTVAMTGN